MLRYTLCINASRASPNLYASRYACHAIYAYEQCATSDGNGPFKINAYRTNLTFASMLRCSRTKAPSPSQRGRSPLCCPFFSPYLAFLHATQRAGAARESAARAKIRSLELSGYVHGAVVYALQRSSAAVVSCQPRLQMRFLATAQLPHTQAVA